MQLSWVTKMKKSEREWLELLLNDPKLRKAWLAYQEEQRQEQAEALKEHFALSLEDANENDA